MQKNFPIAFVQIIIKMSSEQLKGCVELGIKWLLMQFQILLVIHNWIQGNLERESGNLSEVT